MEYTMQLGLVFFLLENQDGNCYREHTLDLETFVLYFRLQPANAFCILSSRKNRASQEDQPNKVWGFVVLP
jgi:hypothetical protein